MTTVQERKAAERQARRRAIQSAAREVFNARGYQRASIEHIARQAQLSVGAIYLYFRSKEDLYVSLLEDTFTMFDAELTHQQQKTEVPERLAATWRYLLAWAERDAEGPRVLRLLAQPGVGAQLSEDVISAIQTGLTKVRGHLASAIADGITAGLYRTVPPDELAGQAWSLLLGTMAARETTMNLTKADAAADDLSAESARAFAMLTASLAPGARSMQVAA